MDKGVCQLTTALFSCEWLDTVQTYYSKHSVKDTFEFVDTLSSHLIPSSAHMCSFEVITLFTNVPLEETINICIDVLVRNDEADTPWMSEAAFREFMFLVMTGVELSFNDMMSRQVDDVAMGYPNGPVLASVFVGYCESLIEKSSWPDLYVRCNSLMGRGIDTQWEEIAWYI